MNIISEDTVRQLLFKSKVTEIAVETGFNDASHFIQYFKRQTGMTPKDYRKC